MEAFDEVATSYDQEFSHTPTGTLQRQRVHRELSSFFRDKPPMRILELNGGTGEDALFFAKMGHHILTTDLSPQMVEVAKKKAEDAGFSTQIDTAILRLPYLKKVSGFAPFDFVFSNFGGLNCLSPQEFKDFCKNLGPIVKPGGWVAFVWMPRFCPWETSYFLLKGKSRESFRRLKKNPVSARVGDQFQPTWYYSPRDFLRELQLTFSLVRKAPIGLFLPPSYLDPLFRRHPRFLSFLNWNEARFSLPILSAWGDHSLLILQKKNPLPTSQPS